jgi:hypothetical protein
MAVTFIGPSLSFRVRGIMIPGLVPMILGLFLLIMVSSVVRDHVPSLWYSLITDNLLGGMLVAFIVVGSLQGVADGWEWLRPLEPVGFGLFLCIPFLSSDGGDFTKPQWLSDLVVQRGSTVETSLFLLGITVAIFSVMTLFMAPKENIPSVKAPLGIICVLFLALVIGYALFQFLPSVPATHRAPPPPPLSFAGNPPPPPPPQPQPVAIIQLSKPLVTMSFRLSGFYFRSAKAGSQDRMDIDTNSPRLLETKIYYIDGGEYPLDPVGRSLGTNIPSPNPQRFKRAELVETLLPSISEGSDFTQKSPESLASINLQTDVVVMPTSPVISNVNQKVDSIISGKEPPKPGSLLESIAADYTSESQLAASLEAGGLVEWLEQNGTLDSDAKAKDPADSEAFLKGGMKGNSRQFSELAVTLLRAKGIKARVAEGYIIPSEKVPTDRLVITDGQKDYWPEVLAKNGVWIPMPVHPEKVVSRQNPPPKEDIKDELFEALKAHQKACLPVGPKSPFKSSLNPDQIFLIIVGVLMVCFAGLCILYRWIQGIWFEPIGRIMNAYPPSRMNHFALHEAAGISEKMFRKREFGESWNEYAGKLANKHPVAGKSFRDMLVAFDRQSQSPSVWVSLYKQIVRGLILPLKSVFHT